jgi:hypothetical protein
MLTLFIPDPVLVLSPMMSQRHRHYCAGIVTLVVLASLHWLPPVALASLPSFHWYLCFLSIAWALLPTSL